MIIRMGELYRLAGGGSLAPGNTSWKWRWRWTGEHRPPKKGDWFLSGNPIEAYYMPNDSTGTYAHYIAEVVPEAETKCPTCGHQR